MPIINAPTEFFGHQFITRKVILAFLDWISKRIYIERYKDDGSIYRYIRVPIQYAQREYFKDFVMSSNVKSNNSTNSLDINRILPRMSLNIIGMTYDPERHLGKRQRVRAAAYDGSGGTLEQVLAPVPYTLDLELSIISKSLDDNFQIVEQIAPYFTPSYSFDLNILPGFEPESIGYILDGVTLDAAEDWGVTDERIFMSNLTFRAKCNYYYIRKDHDAIKEIITNFHVGKGTAGIDETYRKFKKYELDADNPTPVTEIGNREDEPMTETITEFNYLLTESGLNIALEQGGLLILEK